MATEQTIHEVFDLFDELGLPAPFRDEDMRRFSVGFYATICARVPDEALIDAAWSAAELGLSEGFWPPIGVLVAQLADALKPDDDDWQLGVLFVQRNPPAWTRRFLLEDYAASLWRRGREGAA